MLKKKGGGVSREGGTDLIAGKGAHFPPGAKKSLKKRQKNTSGMFLFGEKLRPLRVGSHLFFW